MKTNLAKLIEVTKLASAPGNALANDYMRGMANGLILAEAIMHDKEPLYIAAQAGPRLIDDDPCLKKARHDEPVFIILARDPAAVATLDAWVKERTHLINVGIIVDNQQEWDHIEQVIEEKRAQMRAYQPKSHGARQLHAAPPARVALTQTNEH